MCVRARARACVWYVCAVCLRDRVCVWQVTSWMIAVCGVGALLLIALHRCFCKRNVSGDLSSGWYSLPSLSPSIRSPALYS
eukprot:COSAG02_NODE_31835_length_526_cov_1.236534_2_plen_81_part_00